MGFQSTLPRRERRLSMLIQLLICNFNPRSREGSDDIPFRIVAPTPIFQSTLPRRERHIPAPPRQNTKQISIHAPAKGATQMPDRTNISIGISIHAPAKGATRIGEIPSYAYQFQSTLPRRERHCFNRSEPYILALFQSTLPRRERP